MNSIHSRLLSWCASGVCWRGVTCNAITRGWARFGVSFRCASSVCHVGVPFRCATSVCRFGVSFRCAIPLVGTENYQGVFLSFSGLRFFFVFGCRFRCVFGFLGQPFFRRFRGRCVQRFRRCVMLNKRSASVFCVVDRKRFCCVIGTFSLRFQVCP